MRYVNSLNLNSNIECFILIEPGMGYIVPVLKEKFPKTKIVVLHAENCFPPLEAAVFCGTDHKGLQDFLENEVPQTGSSQIQIIEWRPSLNYYKEKYAALLSAAVEFIKRADAGRRTVSAFGKRWFRNFFKNLRIIEYALLYRETNVPVIVVGSGPSLEKTLPVIREMQDKALIIASSSSVLALTHSGITADIVITTDGGTWALQHVYSCFRKNTGSIASKPQVRIAANLCAALPSQCSNVPRLIINDGSLWQSFVLHSLSLPSVVIPQRGTVAASAAELAMILSSGNIYLAGLDFSLTDIRSHVRPYVFDHLQSSCASRFLPVYSQSFVRSGLIDKGGSLGIYAAWFKNQLTSWPKRIFSLDDNRIFSSASPAELGGKKNAAGYFSSVRVKDPAAAAKKGMAALFAALKDNKHSENLKAELVPLLLPESAAEKITVQELTEVINDLTGEAAYG